MCPPGPAEGRGGRAQCLAVHTAVWDLQKEGVNARSALLSMPGVKGTGKARLANEIVTRDWGRGVKCVSVSYNGGGKEAPVPPPGKEGVFLRTEAADAPLKGTGKTRLARDRETRSLPETGGVT
eukprot:Sspe_Gene.46433::Locus_23192_Transcript_4_10_Confidence_0.307_Length_890::g.46433::m.46433